MQFVKKKDITSEKIAKYLAYGVIEYIKNACTEITFDTKNTKDDDPFFVINPSNGEIVSYRETDIYNILALTGFESDIGYLADNKIGPYSENLNDKSRKTNIACMIGIIEKHLDRKSVLRSLNDSPEFKNYFANKLNDLSNINHLEIAKAFNIKTNINTDEVYDTENGYILYNKNTSSDITHKSLDNNTINMLCFSKLNILDNSDLLHYLTKKKITDLESLVYDSDKINIDQPIDGFNITKAGTSNIIGSEFLGEYIGSKKQNDITVIDLGSFIPDGSYSNGAYSEISFKSGDITLEDDQVSIINKVLVYVDDNPCSLNNPNYSWTIDGNKKLKIQINPQYNITDDNVIYIKLLLNSGDIQFPKINITEYYKKALKKKPTLKHTMFKKLSFYTCIPNIYLENRDTKAAKSEIDNIYMTSNNTSFIFNIYELANSMKTDIEWILSNKDSLDNKDNSKTSKFNIIEYDANNFMRTFMSTFMKYSTKYSTTKNVQMTYIDYELNIRQPKLSTDPFVNRYINTSAHIYIPGTKVNYSAITASIAKGKNEYQKSIKNNIYKLIVNQESYDVDSDINIDEINKI